MSTLGKKNQQIRQQHQFISFVYLSVRQPASPFDSLPYAQTNTLMSRQCTFSSLCTVAWTVPWSYQLCVNQPGMLFVCPLRVASSATSWLHSTPSHTFVRCGCQLSGSRLLRCRRQRIQLKTDVDGNVSSSRLLWCRRQRIQPPGGAISVVSSALMIVSWLWKATHPAQDCSGDNVCIYQVIRSQWSARH